MTAEEELCTEVERFIADPAGYIEFAFPWGEGDLADSPGPHDWQREILDTIGAHLQNPSTRFTPLQIAVSSGHGIGKSALIAMISQWGLSTCDDCRIVVTANTGTQLDTKTWPEISKWFRMAINAEWWDVQATSIAIKEKEHRETWRIDAITWSENNTEAFAGLHNNGKRIIVVYDESSTIADKVWEVTEGALTDADTEIIWIAFGNPTQTAGRFRECFGKYKHRWITKQIDSRTVPGTNKELIAQWIEDYGEDSDFVRIRVRGEFPRAASNQLIGGDLVASARARHVGDQSRAHKILSVDVARFGDDQTIIGYRQGLRAAVLEKLRTMDTFEVGCRVIEHIRKENPRTVVIDGDGIGGGVYDYVTHNLTDERGRPWKDSHPWFNLEEFHGGMTPADAFMYFNRRAEAWGWMRDWLSTGEIPNDPELDTDLTGPQYFHSAKNQIQLERKEDMKKRGLASPDLGDMLAMSFWATVTPKTRDEALREEIAAMDAKDPTEAHFMRLRETERRERVRQPLNYWE